MIDEGTGGSVKNKSNSMKKQFSSVVEPYNNNLLKIEKMEHSPAAKDKTS